MITRKQLVGARYLETYTETDVQSGEVTYPMGKNPEGLMLYTSEGYTSAQLGFGGRDRFKSDPYGASSEEYTAAGRSYIAYSSPFYLFLAGSGRV
jgi:hypothetical protein